MHLLEPLGDLLERSAEALLERRLQFLVDGRAHLLELVRVLLAQHVEPLFERRADRLEPRFRRPRQFRQPLTDFLPQHRPARDRFSARRGEVMAHVALVIRSAAADRFETSAQFGGVARSLKAPAREGEDAHERHGG